jgi:hypothetical protein
MLDFELFGKLSFKMTPIMNSKNKVNEEKTYYLNEQQAYLLLTYLRNSEIVRSFKVALVKAFFEMREALYQKNKHYQINGYKSQIVQHNNKIKALEDELEQWQSPEGIYKLLKDGAKYKQLSDEYCELYSKHSALKAKLNQLTPLFDEIQRAISNHYKNYDNLVIVS